jgi:hypothetical protein
MNDLLWKDGTSLLSPGDLWDTYAILGIKHSRIEDPKLRALAAESRDRLGMFLDSLHRKLGSSAPNKYLVKEYTDDLWRANWYQWDLENRVRTESSWEAAQAARENNTKRVKLKNEINKLYGYPVEVKNYKGEEEKDAIHP